MSTFFIHSIDNQCVLLTQLYQNVIILASFVAKMLRFVIKMLRFVAS